MITSVDSEDIFGHVAEPTVDDISRVGIVFSGGEEYFFVHKTFAEFFLLKFIFESIFLGKIVPEKMISTSVKILQKLLKKFGSFEVVISFLNAALVNTTFEGKTQIDRLKTSFPENFRELKVDPEILHYLAQAKCIKLMELLCCHIMEDFQEFWDYNHDNKSIFQSATETQSIKFIESFLNLTKRLVSQKKLINMFEEFNVFIASSNNKEMLEFWIENAPVDSAKLDSLLMAQTEQAQNIFFHVLDCNENFQTAYEVLLPTLSEVQVKELLVAKHDQMNLLQFAVRSTDDQVSLENLESLTKVLKEKLTQEELEHFVADHSLQVENVFMVAVPRLDKPKLGFLWNFIAENCDQNQQRQILLQSNDKNKIALHLSLINDCEGSYDFVADLYEKLFDFGRIDDLWMKKDCRSVLFLVLMEVVNYSKFSLKHPSFDATRMMLRLRQPQEVVECFLTRDGNGRTLLMAAASFGTFCVVWKLITDVVVDLSFLKEILLCKDSGLSAFYYFLRRAIVVSELLKVVELHSEVLSGTEFSELLMNVDDNKTILQYFLINHDGSWFDEDFRSFLDLLKSKLKLDNLKTLLTKSCQTSDGILFFIVKESNYFSFCLLKTVLEYFEEVFVFEERKQIMLSAIDGSTIFHVALQACNKSFLRFDKTASESFYNSDDTLKILEIEFANYLGQGDTLTNINEYLRVKMKSS